ncbi:protein lethal(2)essential for life-like [Vespa crabro]|uniref:protein lethal(2)essential for life-like n=1 Tax=Vespa crabro TaxID=7445 RepID=UPI001F02ECC9|nr:protein lethal(2)essential for life-like [Vespa crabro]
MRSKMSLIPKLFSHWWETLEQPHRLYDQRFGMGIHPEQFFGSSMLDKLEGRRFSPFSASSAFYKYYRPWADLIRDEDNSGWSVVKNDKDKFHVALDVQQFKPEEVNVKIVNNYIVVEGKHEEQQDDHGVISRHFVRKYLVPDQCDPEKATSSLSSDGILTITAPRKPEAIEEKKERVVKIEHTGKPALENDDKKMTTSQQ